MWLKWILLCSLAFPAWAYRFTTDFDNGFYWKSLPIAITVLESDPVRKDLLESLAQTAIQEWEDRTQLSLWDFTGSQASPSSRNIIRWSNNFAQETRMDASSVLAVAIRYTDGPYFAKTEIIINGNHSLNNNEMHLRTTLTHELGHTMGLDHSDVPDAIMAPSLQPWYSGLHYDDVNGMQGAYAEMEHRQVTGYISPLAYQKEETSSPLSCASITAVGNAGTSANGIGSLVGGILITFVRKVLEWFKSRR